ncbi:hypothetical protein CALCODRAFT_479269 [Calocera cornea HHB12733]|uniref:Uncharacterized protein n=1 Tax=Calocera cornea HHB12733 TaxID=1353952 RepID=A0A165JX56_9BASI|nr:hypothetical protein CALCODRAFT_479269 [Calocera cornea HHB12733]
MLAVTESLPSFPQLMESLGHPEDHTRASTLSLPTPTSMSSSSSSSSSSSLSGAASAWRNPQPVIDEDAASDTRSTTSSRSTRASPVIPATRPLDSDHPHHPRVRKASRSPSGSASKENAGRHRFAPYQGRGTGVPSINIDKANKAAEKALPTPPISQSLRRANRPQPLALAPRTSNPDIAPAPISALLRAHIARSNSSSNPTTDSGSGSSSGLAPHTASPRISGHAQVPHAPRSPRHPMTPVSIPTLPPNLPISPISAQFNKEAYSRRDVAGPRAPVGLGGLGGAEAVTPAGAAAAAAL